MATAAQFDRWQIGREELLKLFSVIEKFPAVSTLVVGFRKQGHALRFVASNRDHYIELTLPLLNDENVEQSTSPIYFNFQTMNYLVQNSAEFFLVWKETKELFFVTDSFQVKVDTFPFNSTFPGRDFVKVPDKPFFPQSVLDALQFLFSQTDNPLESKAFIEKDSVWLGFQEFSGLVRYAPEVKEGDVAPATNWGTFPLRKPDVPILQAFRKASKGKALFCLDGQAGDNRLQARFEGLILSFLIIPPKVGSKEPPKPTLDNGDEAGFDIKRMVHALKTLDFLKAPNVDFFAKGDLIHASSSHAKFIVGKAPVPPFSMSVDKLLSFLGFIPNNGQAPVFRRTTSSVAVGFKYADTQVIFDIKSMMSTVTRVKKAAESSWAGQPAGFKGTPGEGLKQALE